MIPIKLTIQGLYSYQQKQIVDFEKLTKASLFGIFGTVGSGKSSILEAITFALYGKTDRLNLSGDNRNYNMMNLKSNELFIEFIFSVGNDAQRFMILVKGKRNSKNYDDVRSLDRTAYREISGSWEPIEVESLKTIIGLTYENFKRTIIIPQGQFQEFLQLKPNDRTIMMKELFGLEKFELSNKVKSLEAANNQNLNIIDGQLMQLGAVDKSQIEIAEAELNNVVAEIENTTKSLLHDRVQNLEVEKLQTLFKKQDELQVELTKAKECEAHIADLETKVKSYEYCFANFKPLLDNALVKSKIIEQQHGALKNSTSTLDVVTLEIEKLSDQFEVVSKAFQNRENSKQQADELSKIIRLNELWQSSENLQGRSKKGFEEVAKLQHKIEELKNKQLVNSEVLKGKKAERKDIGVLTKAKEWHAENRQLVKLIEGNEADLKLIHAEIAQITNEAFSKWSDDLLKDIPQSTNFESIISVLAALKSTFQTDLKKVDSDLEHFRVQSKLADYADDLHNGVPCPLCGSLEHPKKFTSTELAAQTEQLTRKREVEEQKIGKLDIIIALFSGFKIKLDLKNENSDKLQINKQLLLDKYNDHAKKFIWAEYADEAVLDNAFSSAVLLDKSIATIENEVEVGTKEIENALVNLERFKAEIDKITLELQNSETEAKVINGQLQFFKSNDFLGVSKEQLLTRKNELELTYRKIEVEFNTLSTTLQQQNEQKTSLVTLIEVAKKRIIEEQMALAEIELNSNNLLNSSSFSSIDEINNLLIQNIDVAKEQKKITDFHQLKVNLETQLVEVERAIHSRQYDKLMHHELLQRINEQNGKVDLLNQRQGALATEIAKLKLNFSQLAELTKSREELQLRASNLKVLNTLFKGNGFVNYISTVHLQNLCAVANERFFKLTQQKMSLELEPDNSFRVRDYMNGGKTRSVKTLSGGQTFQAALSLALALSDSIQKMASSNENFFFLDEGFGSLDKQSLSVVFDTLKSLRKESRIVGVISHVEEMQQEIGTFLSVVNSDEKGSLIENSWEV